MQGVCVRDAPHHGDASQTSGSSEGDYTSIPEATPRHNSPSAGAADSLKLRNPLPCATLADAARNPCVALAAAGTCAAPAPPAAFSATRPPTARTTLRIMTKCCVLCAAARHDAEGRVDEACVRRTSIRSPPAEKGGVYCVYTTMVFVEGSMRGAQRQNDRLQRGYDVGRARIADVDRAYSTSTILGILTCMEVFLPGASGWLVSCSRKRKRRQGKGGPRTKLLQGYNHSPWPPWRSAVCSPRSSAQGSS